MKALFIIINQDQVFEPLLSEFHSNNIRGGTIFDSQGMFEAMHHQEESLHQITGSLRMLLHKGRPFNKTIMLILDDQKLEIAKKCVHTVVGDINRENVGIMFTLPVEDVEGLTK